MVAQLWVKLVACEGARFTNLTIATAWEGQPQP